MPHLVRVHDDGRADVGFDALLDDGREASRERDEREAGGCQEGVIGGDAPHRDYVYSLQLRSSLEVKLALGLRGSQRPCRCDSDAARGRVR